MKHIMGFVKREPVLVIAALLAVVSMFFVPPSAEYLEYIDLRVLCLLFCLMAVVAGLRSCGLFEILSQKLLAGKKSFRTVALALVLLPFFLSMLVTNDVALIAFVPFAIFILNLANRRDAIIRVVVLQTVAANLGSMATPVGNPQNLFLYAKYEMSAGDFFGLLVPLTLISLALLVAASVFRGGERVELEFEERAKLQSPPRFWCYVVLFALCLLSVFRVLPYPITTAVVVVAMLVLAPKLLKEVDYFLLLTFVCFFIFSGNLGRIPQISGFLSGIVGKNTLIASAAVSQVISNVPAAVLLSGFTDNALGLLAGVDVGGLGTPVASLASLISLKFYLAQPDRRLGRYLLVFTVANLVGLAVLLPIAALLVR